ncbi:MAG TPA: adenylosuccinate lyase [Bacteroidia bacterium]|nr:adenylosuccinate lyase [Bacteroidia bacterium]HNS12637.1 adenylosuccinate lyase [Bacteroidia bacterium]
MDSHSLTAISPVDGRYKNQTQILTSYFSEEALMKYRLKVEIEYFLALCEIPLPQLKNINLNPAEKFRDLYRNFSGKDAVVIKEKERITNHDVKALEYFIKDSMSDFGWENYKEFIHFGLTSQDINNTAFPLATKDAIEECYLPALQELVEKLDLLSHEWNEIPMLARTHGQAASPTRLGKEIKVFVERLERQMFLMDKIPFSAKFGGATGNFNAHHVAYPELDWKVFANYFVNQVLGLNRQQYTTQIEHYDDLAALFDNLKRINTILIDFSRDIWTYISMDYFKQEIKAGEVGSSAMPHKVNPIDFENAEGNLGIANSLFEHLAAKLPVSRLQRDLTDSTVLRNTGVPFAHTLIAVKSIMKGLSKIRVNPEALNFDLDNNWAVIAEAIQTILRRENYLDPYEALKGLTRTGDKITKASLHSFIGELRISEELKTRLKAITPFNYTGI